MDHAKKFKGKDGYDLLAEDIDSLVENCNTQSYEYNKDAQDVVTSSNSGGVIEGLTLTPAAGKVTIAAGVAQNKDGLRAYNTVPTDLSIVAGDVGKYIVMNIITQDDTSTDRTHPFSGVVNATQTEIAFSFAVLAGASLVDTYVCLAKIDSLSGTTPVLNDMASVVFPSVGAPNIITFFPYSGGADLRGFDGNNYHVRIQNEIGAVLSISEKTVSGVDDNYYLDIIVPADSLGAATISYTDLDSALTLKGLSCFTHSITGGPSSALLSAWSNPEQYHSLSGGDSYRRYWYAKTDQSNLDNHESKIGHGIVSSNNPHGMKMEDVTGYDADNLPQHKRRDHLYQKSGIAKHSDIGFLATTVLGATATIAGVPSGNNNAVINGYSILSINNASSGGDYVYPHPVYLFSALYEFKMSQQGNVYQDKIIDIQASSINPIRPIDLATLYPAFAFISKSPKLIGDIDVEIVVSGGGSVYVIRIDDGAGNYGVAVDCSSGINRVYNPDGHYIEFNREPGITLADGTKGNKAVCTESRISSTYLPISEVFWGGNRNTWGYGAGSDVVDVREYGTDSDENDFYDDFGNSLGYGISFEDGTSIFTSAGGMKPCVVSYRGIEYSIPAMDSATLSALLSAGDNFLVARFNNVRTCTITNIGSSLSTWNRQTDVLLAYVNSPGVGITSSISYSNLVKNEIVSNTLDIGLGGWTVLDAIRYSGIVYKTFPNITITWNLISDNTFTHPGLIISPVPSIFVKGNGYTIKVNPLFAFTSLSISTNKVVGENCLFEDFAFKGIAGAVQQSYKFNNCDWASSNSIYAVQTTSGTAYANFTNCGFSLSTIVDANATTTNSYFNNCTNTSGLIVDASGNSICTIEESVLGTGRFNLDGTLHSLNIINNRSWSIGTSPGVDINVAATTIANVKIINNDLISMSGAQTSIIAMSDSGTNTKTLYATVKENTISSDSAGDADIVYLETDNTYNGNIDILGNKWITTSSVVSSAAIFCRMGSTITGSDTDTILIGTLTIKENRVTTNSTGGQYLDYFVACGASASTWNNHGSVTRLTFEDNYLSGSGTIVYVKTVSSSEYYVNNNKFLDTVAATLRSIAAAYTEKSEICNNIDATYIYSSAKLLSSANPIPMNICNNIGAVESSGGHFIHIGLASSSEAVVANIRDNYADMTLDAAGTGYAVNCPGFAGDVSTVVILNNISANGGAGLVGTLNANIVTTNIALVQAVGNYRIS